MSNIKKYLFSLLTTLATILITLLLITSLYYFNLISPSAYNIIKIIVLLLTLFTNGFLIGKSSSKKGYLEGIKLSIPIIILFLIITLITKSFTIKVILYYIILILTTSFGSMVGINKKES